MYKYLVDLKSGKVLLKVDGPLRVKPGQELLTHKKDIPISKALYDPEAGAIVEMTAGTHAELRRQSKATRDSVREEREAPEREKAAEFAKLLKKQRSKSVQRLFELLLTTDPGFLREAVGEGSGGE
tara:strand:+ start:155 stop:532 length:378 start_codon:yes stop_codon:yes gene_type:complete